jgi:hypothetical protein
MKNILSTITLGLVLAGCASHEDEPAPVVLPTETPCLNDKGPCNNGGVDAPVDSNMETSK